MKFAGFWIRFLAAIIDGLIISVIASILSLGNEHLQSLIGFIFGVTNSIILQGIKGQTVGKMVLGLQVIRNNGQDIDIVTAIVRYVGQIISALILMIGFIMAGFTKNKQALHDMIAGTYVIYQNSREQFQEEPIREE